MAWRRAEIISGGSQAGILRFFASSRKGRTLIEIAQAFGVAYKTIANTCTRIREKLGARSLAELVECYKGPGTCLKSGASVLAPQPAIVSQDQKPLMRHS